MQWPRVVAPIGIPCTLPRMGKNRVQSMVEHLHFASDYVSRRT